MGTSRNSIAKEKGQQPKPPAFFLRTSDNDAPQRYRGKGCLAGTTRSRTVLTESPILSSPSTLAAPEEEALSLRTDSLAKHSTFCAQARKAHNLLRCTLLTRRLAALGNFLFLTNAETYFSFCSRCIGFLARISGGFFVASMLTGFVLWEG